MCGFSPLARPRPLCGRDHPHPRLPHAQNPCGELRVRGPLLRLRGVPDPVGAPAHLSIADQAAPSANLSTHVVGVDRAAPAIYDDLHNCAGWPPSDSSSSTVSDPSTCKTWRSSVHERNENSLPSEARLLACLQRTRTESLVVSFDGPVIDIVLVACGRAFLDPGLFFSQNAASRSSRIRNLSILGSAANDATARTHRQQLKTEV